MVFWFLADHTNGHTYAALLFKSVFNVMYCG